MTLDWTAFTPWPALAGGLLIGTAAGLLMLGSGRIAGISGILGSPIQALLSARPLQAERPQLLFLAGLLLSPWLWQLLAPLPAHRPVAGVPALVVAGLLVGLGTRMGQGCTSGHGVCGLSRGSPRSLTNVVVFMGLGMATVAMLRLLG